MEPIKPVKPLLRGHLHQAAFFSALGACSVLIAAAAVDTRGLALVYGLSLVALFGISSLYHRLNWQPAARMWMRRLDHSAIYILIAGTCTPVTLLALPSSLGAQLCALVWGIAGVGILKSLCWPHAPKWLSALLYIGMGWVIMPYMGQLSQGLGRTELTLLVTGGVIYSLGAVVYALGRPNPSPQVFGYHEIFHGLVIVAAAMHFIVVYRLV